MFKTSFTSLSVFILIITLQHALPALAQEEKTSSPQKQNGEFVETGWHDNGSCNGDDRAICRSKGPNSNIGCVRQENSCASGFAVAVAVEPGDGQCVRNWYRWECGDQVAASTIYSREDTPAIIQWRKEMQSKNNARHKIYAERKARIKKARQLQQNTNPCTIEQEVFRQLTPIAIGISGGAGPIKEPWSDNSNHGSVTINVDEAVLSGIQNAALILSSNAPVEWNLSRRLASVTKLVIVSSQEPSLVEGAEKGASIIYTNPEMRGSPRNALALDQGTCTEIPIMDVLSSPRVRLVEQIITENGGKEFAYALSESKIVSSVSLTSINRLETAPLKRLRAQWRLSGAFKSASPGEQGIKQLLDKKLIRPADLDDIQVVEHNLSARTKVFNTLYKANTSFEAGKTYVVTGKINIPAGLEKYSFFIPKSTPIPDLSAGNYQIYNAQTNKLMRVRVDEMKF